MSLTKVSYSMISGAPVNVLDYGADPTGAVDSKPAIQAAIDSGATDIVIPPGTYRINSTITILSTSAVKSIAGQGLATLKLYTAVQASIFQIEFGKQLFSINNLVLDSNGTKNDGLSTYGILSIGNAYAQFDNIRATNFSGAGMEIRQCVYVGISNFTANSCTYGLSFEKYSGVQCTAYKVNRAYISGCTRGIYQNGSVNATYDNCVIEYSGSSTSTDGAFHLAGGTAECTFMYFEANARNIVSVDANATMKNASPYAATAADVVTYSALPFSERGWDWVYPYKQTISQLNADTFTNHDLVIGENLTVPVAGGSVIFGNETMYSASGTLTNGVWTTVYTIPAAEVTGTAVNAKAMYEYTCYAGSADLSTGFDSGTIMNSTLRSYSGSTPAWLQLSGNLVQMNVTSYSYGLTYKIVMRRVYPGN